MSALWYGWAVVIVPRKGGEWTYPGYLSGTRAKAIKRYNANMPSAEYQYARQKRRGKVYCIRVQLTVPQ